MSERINVDVASPTTRLVDRLRDSGHCNDWYLRQEAAAQIEELFEALEAMTEHFGPLEENQYILTVKGRRCFALAHAALSKAVAS